MLVFLLSIGCARAQQERKKLKMSLDTAILAGPREACLCEL